LAVTQPLASPTLPAIAFLDNTAMVLVDQPSTHVYPNPAFVPGDPGCLTLTFTLMNSDCITPYSGANIQSNIASGIYAVQNDFVGWTEVVCIIASDSSALNIVYD
jgi:hypothetical protein